MSKKRKSSKDLKVLDESDLEDIEEDSYKWSALADVEKITKAETHTAYLTDKYKTQRNKWLEFSKSKSLPTNKEEMLPTILDDKLASFMFNQWQQAGTFHSKSNIKQIRGFIKQWFIEACLAEPTPQGMKLILILYCYYYNKPTK
jgi:hypothetical protein